MLGVAGTGGRCEEEDLGKMGTTETVCRVQAVLEENDWQEVNKVHVFF